MQIPSFGRWFSRHAALPIRCGLAGARERYSRRCSDRLDEPNQAIPRHGCIPAEPAAVSPGKIIVPRIVIGGVILDQPADGGIGAAKRGASSLRSRAARSGVVFQSPEMCPQFRRVAVTSHVHNVVALREVLETLNPALKLGRGNGGFRERRNLVLESQKPTNELQAAKEGLSGVRPRAARQGRSCNHRTRGI